MASRGSSWAFRPNARQLKHLEDYQEEHDSKKAEAVEHYVERGIEAENGEGEPAARDWPLLNTIAVQFAVMGIFILMLGPGLGVVGQSVAMYTALGLIALGFWIGVVARTDLFDGWIDRLEAYYEEQTERENEKRKKSHGD